MLESRGGVRQGWAGLGVVCECGCEGLLAVGVRGECTVDPNRSEISIFGDLGRWQEQKPRISLKSLNFVPRTKNILVTVPPV